ncbi:hypothetical protein TTHERM_00490980 (macronuclear) [Tetrahymena thermophila SB210]|uniref:Transmembrane protein n=1 Tax=Tetrahymena thermophila (strain SB210) TaxID=312017 RepID=Q23J74_TETTS|nr:hypothetical protein TTHERM_00490980 [Tetrahymena thermophila SB210]EAR96630.1 hypothetical protein TTHERM_00490980 [Tetrahymena thermophila SB210]|eukprot:XP_001016875.1 hypothetical protein TTHERM_00490980 [Tetrahymena thermophila SB210]
MRILISFALLLLALNSINCYNIIDNININKYRYFYLTQDQLSAQISTDSNALYCPTINQYYETMAYNASLSLNSTLSSHNYISIKFDAVFTNVARVMGGAIKQAQINVNGNITTFQALANFNFCNPQASKVDGKTTFTVVQAHSGDLSMVFNPTNLGGIARLGISNIQVDAFQCGQNAELNLTSLTCVCSQGFAEALTVKQSQGPIYYIRQCI